MMPQPMKTVMRFGGKQFIREYPYEDAYLLEHARRVRAEVRLPMVLLGGITDRASMDLAMQEGFEFVAMGRALLREPDLVNRIAADASTPSLCIHCNLLHAHQLRRHALPGRPRGQLALGHLGHARRLRLTDRRPTLRRMDSEFDRGIAVEAVGPGEYAAELDGGWVVGGGLNGGYLLAVIGTAIRAELADLGQPDPISVSAYYLSPTTPGPAVVRVRRVREGGQRSTVAASLVQQQDGAEVERITVLGVYGSLDRMPAEVAAAGPAPRPASRRGLRRGEVRPRGGPPGRAPAGAVRHPPRPGVRRLGRRRAEPERHHPGLVQARRRPASRPGRPAARRRRAAAGHLRPRPARAGPRPSSSPRTCAPSRRRAG